MRTSLALCALALVAASLTACSDEAQMRATDPAGSDAAVTSDDSPAASGDAPADDMPTTIPAADGPVATRGLVTVLDDGDGPELCLGAIAESYPPQCSGVPMTGWDWSEHTMHEKSGDVRWGGFYVAGTFDGTDFEVAEAIPAALYDAIAAPDEDPLTTPCAEPAEGWVVDETKAGPEQMDATLTAAAALPGYAMAWLDDQIINVAVTEDPAGAEATLRETWGGALCVTEAEHTEAELQAIQLELNELPGMLSSGSTRPDQFAVQVVHDDGSLQEWVDAAYGDGLVEVTSALVPMEGSSAG